MGYEELKSLHYDITIHKNGRCNDEEFEEYLQSCLNGIEDLVDTPNLFWVANQSHDSSFDRWEIRSKVNIRLCGEYLQGFCSGHCNALHMCKNFIISGRFCQGRCKFGYSHDILEDHNTNVWATAEYSSDHNVSSPNMALIRSSFPRLCNSFRKNGSCSQIFCGYIHICPDIVYGECTGKCQSWNNGAYSKGHYHNWASEHNKKVLNIFDLSYLRSERDVLVSNLLYFGNVNAINEDSVEEIVTQSNISPEKSIQYKQPLLLCYNYSMGNCNKGSCPRLHMCKEYLINGNKCKVDNCKFGYSHDPLDDDNASVIRKHNMDALSASAILEKLRKSFPRICKEYDKNLRCMDNNCRRMHICLPYIFDKCQNADCDRSHDFRDTHNLEVLTHFSLDKIKDKKFITTNILCSKVNASTAKRGLESSKPSANTTQSSADGSSWTREFNFLKEAVICHHYLISVCDAGTRCKLLHPQNRLPYIWQYKFKQNDSWIPLSPGETRSVEQEFCDPSKDSGKTGNIVVYFKYIQKDKCFAGTYEKKPAFVRRLSTKSSTDGDRESGLTEWKWYWCKSPTNWEEYSNGVSSQEIENFYHSYSDGVLMRIKTDEFEYNLNFVDMVQQNLDERYYTKREMRRRPVFQSSAHMISNSCTPDHWPKNCSVGLRLKVPSAKYKSLKNEFIKSVGIDVRIKNIEEICNVEYYEKYEGKKRNLGKKVGETNIDERLLYHGTDPDIVSSICAQNFDWRLCGKNATAYGQGSYFARDASYSHNYTTEDRSSIRYMFVANVLVGRFTKGSPSLKRPPLIPSSEHELYDSCVNDIRNPSIFVIFERDQCYPRYLISYTDNSRGTAADRVPSGVPKPAKPAQPAKPAHVYSGYNQSPSFTSAQITITPTPPPRTYATSTTSPSWNMASSSTSSNYYSNHNYSYSPVQTQYNKTETKKDKKCVIS